MRKTAPKQVNGENDTYIILQQIVHRRLSQQFTLIEFLLGSLYFFLGTSANCFTTNTTLLQHKISVVNFKFFARRGPNPKNE